MQSLSERAGKINAGMVDPSEDNMLCVTLGRPQDRPGPAAHEPSFARRPEQQAERLRLATCCVIWEEGKEERLTQLLFCDLSTPKGDGQFNVYDDVKKKLLAAGVPESEVAFIHTADTEAKKEGAVLQSAHRAGAHFAWQYGENGGRAPTCRTRLVAVHHLDVGWKPSDMTPAQRAHHPAGQSEQDGADLQLRHGRDVRRVLVPDP